MLLKKITQLRINHEKTSILKWNINSQIRINRTEERMHGKRILLTYRAKQKL